MSDDHLEHKVLDICKSINLTVENIDIEGCHRIGKNDPKTTAVRFFNRKFCNLILDKKHELKKLTMQNYVFKTMRNYFLVRICLVLTGGLLGRRASEIHSSFSSKGIVKIRRTMNERPISIEHDRDLIPLYPDFIFKGK